LLLDIRTCFESVDDGKGIIGVEVIPELVGLNYTLGIFKRVSQVIEYVRDVQMHGEIFTEFFGKI